MSGPPSRLSSTIRFRPEAGRNSLMQYVPNFRPEQAGNITLWLDASVYSTFTFRIGTQVLTWQDKINPASLFVLAGDTTDTPIYSSTGFNGLPTVRFGPNKGLKNSAGTPYTLTSNNAVTIFLVGLLDSTPTQNSVMFRAAKMDDDTPKPLDIGADPMNFYNWYGAFDIASANDYANNQMVDNLSPTVVCFSIPSGSSNEKLYLNANSAYNPSAVARGTTTLSGQWDMIFIGTNGAPGPFEAAWVGSISEVLVYDTSLSDADTAKVSAYLGQKWGFQSSLTTPYNTETVYRPVTSGPLFSLRNAQI